MQRSKTAWASIRWSGADGSQHLLALDRPETIVGRHDECHIVIPDPSLSRQHAKVLCSEGSYVLVDLASINGTYVNGRRIQACLLRPGDRIQFGKIPQLFHFDDGTAIHGEVKTAAPDRGGSSVVAAASAEELTPARISNLLQAELRKSVEQRWDLDRELGLAGEIQEALLPRQMPEIHGYRVCTYAAPTRYVGGDFFDFLAPSKSRLYGMLGDVSGKGVAASLLSSMVLGCLDTKLRTGTRLEDAVRALNVLLCEKGCGRFVTLFLFQLISTGQGRFVSAGHNPVFMYRESTAAVVDLCSNSPIVGAFPSSSFQSEAMAMYPGDLMLVYSDGLTDAQSAGGEMLGESQVHSVLQQRSREGPECVKASLLELLDRFTEGHKQVDDITFVVVQRK